MKTFEQNMVTLYAHEGEAWLAQVSQLVDNLSTKWQLTDLKPVDNLTYNYVLTGMQGSIPIILKISCDPTYLQKEANAIAAFAGHSCAKLLNQDSVHGAFLLERAVPGISLKSYFPHQDEQAVKICCDIMLNL